LDFLKEIVVRRLLENKYPKFYSLELGRGCHYWVI